MQIYIKKVNNLEKELFLQNSAGLHIVQNKMSDNSASAKMRCRTVARCQNCMSDNNKLHFVILKFEITKYRPKFALLKQFKKK